MNINQLLSMVMRIVTRRAMNWGINKGVDQLAKRGKGATPDGKLSPAARKQAANMRATVKRARQAARITRRLGR